MSEHDSNAPSRSEAPPCERIAEITERLEHRSCWCNNGQKGTCPNCDTRWLLAQHATLIAERDEASKRASTLEDAAFHFQTCRTCWEDGEESCTSGRQFAAFLRGEEMTDA
jgi:hypothetical protein